MIATKTIAIVNFIIVKIGDSSTLLLASYEKIDEIMRGPIEFL